MERYRNMIRLKPGVRVLLLLLVAACCFSCGPQVIKGRAPFVSISSMNLADSKLAVTFDIRNHNGIPMTIDMIDITVTIDGVALARENRGYDLIVGANSAERVRVENLPDEKKQALLKSLESGDVNSLPFDLKGRVRTVEDNYLSFEQKGYLYPVPGKPGDFRAAVTHAQGLQRDEKL